MTLLPFQQQVIDEVLKTKRTRKPGMRRLTGRKHAGTRKNKRLRTVPIRSSDYAWLRREQFDLGMKPNHAERAVSIKDAFTALTPKVSHNHDH